MPIGSSHLRKTRKAIYGWTEEGKFYTSIKPRPEKAAANEHATAQDALREASQRELPLIWENPEEIA